jgi:DNA repair protein RadC
VFRPAIQEGSAAIVLVHNHPSGDPTPSRDDVEITRRLVRAGNLIGIEVLDHVIVSLAAYRSLRREGLMDASDASGFAG